MTNAKYFQLMVISFLYWTQLVVGFFWLFHTTFSNPFSILAYMSFQYFVVRIVLQNLALSLLLSENHLTPVLVLRELQICFKELNVFTAKRSSLRTGYRTFSVFGFHPILITEMLNPGKTPGELLEIAEKKTLELNEGKLVAKNIYLYVFFSIFMFGCILYFLSDQYRTQGRDQVFAIILAIWIVLITLDYELSLIRMFVRYSQISKSGDDDEV